jgi:hypothetical protein
MYQQLWPTGRSEMLCPPLSPIQLWLEEEDKEESKRLGELKERQKQRQKAFEDEVRRRQEHAPRVPSPPGFAEDEKPI